MSDLRLQIVNTLSLADELAKLELNAKTAWAPELELLQRQLEHVLQTARRVAGLDPDGSFKPVPRPRPPKRAAR